jgi:hypothetical protein
MNIYIVNRTDKWSYDDYSSFVVISKDEKTALHTHPDGSILTYVEEYSNSWVTSPMFLEVKLIGTARRGAKQGVVLNSFHAG